MIIKSKTLDEIVLRAVRKTITELKSSTYFNAANKAYERVKDEDDGELRKGRVKPFRNKGLSALASEKDYLVNEIPTDEYEELNDNMKLEFQNKKLSIYDSDYTSLEDLYRGVKNGKLLIHCEVMDGEPYGGMIYPTIGDFVRTSYSDYINDEEDEDSPSFLKELVFASDNLEWVKKSRNGVFFVESDTFLRYIGDDMVMTPSGKIWRDGNLSASVERGDWFSEEPCCIVAVLDYNKNAES